MPIPAPSRATQNDSSAKLNRKLVRISAANEPPKKGSLLAALRRSPLVGSNLETVRPNIPGRPIDL